MADSYKSLKDAAYGPFSPGGAVDTLASYACTLASVGFSFDQLKGKFTREEKWMLSEYQTLCGRRDAVRIEYDSLGPELEDLRR